MFDVIKDEGSVPIKHWTKHVGMEEQAEQQLRNVAKMPFIHKHIAVMPDVHWGMGATIGSVVPTEKAIIPAAVGVDIGCGMCAVPTSIMAHQLPDDLKGVRSAIEAAVPHGRSNNGGQGDVGAWVDGPPNVFERFKDLQHEYVEVITKHPKLYRNANPMKHLGTLGGGNHFIEVCLDESDRVWIMLHSGSRGIGNRIGMHFITLAKKDMQRWFINLPDQDLAYFPEGSEHFSDYLQALNWAQRFASRNRQVMLEEVVKAMTRVIPNFNAVLDERVINCHHNYVSKEHHYGKNVWLTRKGAVRAREGDLGIIPGSMGRRSFIVRGKGNPESFCSCSHGAGRAMSRTQAKKQFSVEDHERATIGVECRKDEGVLDETPGAYKDIDAVMSSQSDLVEVVHTLKQVVCVKG